MEPAGSHQDPIGFEQSQIASKRLYCEPVVLAEAVGPGRHGPEGVPQRQMDDVEMPSGSCQVAPPDLRDQVYARVQIDPPRKIGVVLAHDPDHGGIGLHRHHLLRLHPQSKEEIQPPSRLEEEDLGPIGQTIGKSGEEVLQEGTHGWVRRSGDGPQVISVHRDPDLIRNRSPVGQAQSGRGADGGSLHHLNTREGVPFHADQL